MTKQNPDSLKEIRTQVEKAIKDSGLTIEQFCWKTGINKATMSNFLNQKKDFQVSTLQKIAKSVRKNLVIRLE